jgi:hypothetical protein
MLVNSRGKICLTGATRALPGVGAIEITYTHGKRIWVIARDSAGGFNIRCPHGKREAYPAGEVAAAGCGPIAACGTGSCP